MLLYFIEDMFFTPYYVTFIDLLTFNQ